MKYFSIAIDGPAGSGKSTVARILAKRLRFIYLDSGAMYRAIAWRIIKRKDRYEGFNCISESGPINPI